MRRLWWLMVVGLVVACGAPRRSVRVAAGGCRAQGQGVMVAPDRRAGCTPGAWIADRDVSAGHVCSGGYNPRPGTSVSGPLKHHAELLYGETSLVDRRVEADHLFPRWLGGATVLANIWPEPNWPRAHGFDLNPKDALEGALFRLVCSQRRMSPAQARAVFEGDWRAGYSRWVLSARGRG